MVTATYQQGALAVLSSFIVSELRISRSQLGVAFAAFSLVGGAVSMTAGRLADLNARMALVGLFLMGGTGLLVASLASNGTMLIIAGLLGGWALASGNPVTNRVVRDWFSTSQRGPIIGIKQTGPPLGIFIAGITLPGLANLLGWRLALGLGVLLPTLGLAAVFILLPRPESKRLESSAGRLAVGFPLWWITAIGLLVALGSSSLTAFLPLFAQEAVSLTPTAAGHAVAAMGAVGAIGRIVWASISNRFQRALTPMLIACVLALLSTISVAMAARAGSVWLYVGAVGFGASAYAWHSLAWLFIVNQVETLNVGKLSGIMQAGSSLGFALGPPLAGLLVDHTNSYQRSWELVAFVFGLAALMTLLLRRTHHTFEP